MNPLTLRLIDSSDDVTYDILEVPFEELPIDGKTNIETADGNVFSYVTYSGKRQWSHTWSWMTEEEYLRLRAFERRQYSDPFQRPLITIARLGVENVPVVMEITAPRKIVSNCGTVQGVSVTWRETIQNSIGV